MIESQSTRVVNQVMSLIPIGQIGMVAHVLESQNIAPDSAILSEIVFRTAEKCATDRESLACLGYLLACPNQYLLQLWVP